MPTYDYLCQECGRPFEVRLSMAEYSKGKAPRCPHCGATKAIRKFTAINLGAGSARGGGVGAGGWCGGSPGCCG